MRVEQQGSNVIDILQQNIEVEEKGNGVSFSDKIAVKSSEKANTKSVNVKDATYLKPGSEEKKTVVDEIEEGAAMDARERKNQMTVLSNTTSEEDYAKMQEDGFCLDSTTANTIVTVTDKIKAELAKAGVDISCFGDDLDLAQLEEITGNTELAVQVAAELRKNDLPLTEENIKDTAEALNLAASLQTPQEGAVKYMLDNHLPPTIENLYKAEYSGSSYYKSAESVDISSFSDQIEKIIQQSGLSVNEQTMSDSQWMLENDIPLTAENLQYIDALKNGVFPVDTQKALSEIATAVAEGKRPQDAMVLPGFDYMSQAEHVMDVVSGVTEADIQYVMDHNMDMTVKSLEYAAANRTDVSHTSQAAAGSAAQTSGETVQSLAEISVTSNTVETEGISSVADASGTQSDFSGSSSSGEYSERGLAYLTARRQLEEVRLAMTTEANYALLKRGVAIDTEPLEKLIEELRAEESRYYENLLKAQGVDPTEKNVSVFRETAEKIAEMKVSPAYVLGVRGINATVNSVHSAGAALKETFEKANARYETLMIMPQEDFGDSYDKAFESTENILKELGLENSEANQRAVRILGYNQLEISPESVMQMKNADEAVQRVFKNMTPAVVTQMVKKGINPLDMDFENLNQVAEKMRENLGDEDSQKFSEFLWKLERNDAITEEERSSYIGIYRLIHQVEQTDGAAVGALVNQGTDITMRNLMMAVRTERKGGKMDIVVDDSFGERVNGGYQERSITDQIEVAYQKNCLKDVVESLSPEKLKLVMEQMPEWGSMVPEQFREALKQVQSQTNDVKLDYEYAKEQLEQFQASAKADQNIYEVLQKYDIPNTSSNIIAMESMVNDRNSMFRQLFGKKTKESEESNQVSDDGKQEILSEFQNALKGPEELAKAQEKLEEYAENAMKEVMESEDVTNIDVRQMRLLTTQISIMGQLARDEQYSVPVQVGDEIISVSLKIVRGADKKGIVDIMMESEAHGKIAATFQAKDNGITGLVATDNRDTREFLEKSGELFTENFDGEEKPEVHYAHIAGLDLNHFSMGMFGVEADSKGADSANTENSQIQTGRLYHIAESFIQTIREVL